MRTHRPLLPKKSIAQRRPPPLVLAAAITVGAARALPAQQPLAPPLEGLASFEEVVESPWLWAPRLSPDGERVAWIRNRPSLAEDAHHSELRVRLAGGGTRTVVTSEEGFYGAGEWTPDGRALAFLVRGRGGSELRLVAPEGDTVGARSLPLELEGVQGFALSPDGKASVLFVRDRVPERERRLQELYGPFEEAGQSTGPNVHLWLLSLEDGSLRRLTGGAFSIREAVWSPTGRELAVVHGPVDNTNAWWRYDLSRLDVRRGDLVPLASERGAETNPVWSPDGQQVAFLTDGADTITTAPARLAVVSRTGGAPRLLADTLTRRPLPVAWDAAGIHLGLQSGTRMGLYRLDPARPGVLHPTTPPDILAWPEAASMAAGAVAFLGARPNRPFEIHLMRPGSPPRAVTDNGRALEKWPLGTREVVSWTAADGTPIEGVLHRPEGFEPGRRYPLLVIVHGGPRATSFPTVRGANGVYPVLHWLWKGALVLEPNYRGSIGYGRAFRELHHRALGTGDGGDVLAGVEALVERGLVDPDRVGVMGWSYGGFLAAWLAVTSDVFRAASVGAGISDWRIHYAWEPNHLTTRFYSFGATPWEDPDAYAAASPLTHVGRASTPTLIQHVEGDPTVPVLGAKALYRGLSEHGVETRLVVFPGRGHGVRSPRQQLGGLWQNWQWFLRHLWREEVEIPTGTGARADPRSSR